MFKWFSVYHCSALHSAIFLLFSLNCKFNYIGEEISYVYKKLKEISLF